MIGIPHDLFSPTMMTNKKKSLSNNIYRRLLGKASMNGGSRQMWASQREARIGIEIFHTPDYPGDVV
jgi:hypothetical protein